MKKILSVLASLAVIAAGSSSMALTASADADVVFEVSTVSTVGEVADGVLVNDETVRVPVNVTQNVGLTAFLLEFTQADGIQITTPGPNLKKVTTEGSVFKGIGSFLWNLDSRCLLWSESSCSDTDNCGLVITLDVNVPAGTPVGTYEIGFEESTIQVTNTNFDSLEFSLVPGGIEVGGDTSQNPPAPVVTEAPPVVTQAPETTKLPTKATQPAKETTAAPAKQTEAAAVTTKKSGAAPAADTSAATASSGAATETALQTNSENAALTTTVEENAVTGNVSDVKSSESAAATGGSSSKKDSKSDSKKNDNSSKKSSANKTSDSPSTGVKGIALPAAFLAVSTVGVIAASKTKKK